ncbi:hypothetical protein AAVH_09370 [Aphelenchoides avenae]|nr:hypothetical protein AAVH_09370 [Aphelenchus avenae]
MKALRLWLAYDVFDRFSWAFLRQNSARGLRLLKVSCKPSWEGVYSPVEELVRCCGTLPRLRGGEALVLDFSEHNVSLDFVLWAIEMLKDSRRKLTFRMTTQFHNPKLELDESDYSVDVDNDTTWYTSKKSGIAVEVTRRSVTIHSSADAPPTKRSRVADE